MPLLNKKSFKKVTPPADLQPDEEVFYCEPTKEVFRDYDDFFERMILCNSLVWSCELSGRCGLTYLEAEQTEKAARKSLSSIPTPLKKAVLLLCTRIHKTAIKELVSEMNSFIRDRFFLGETVQIQDNNATWVEGRVTDIRLADSSTANNARDRGALSEQESADVSALSSSQPPASSISPGNNDVAAVSDVVYGVLLSDNTVRRVRGGVNGRLRRDRCALGADRLRVLLRHSTRVDATSGGRLVLRPAVLSRWHLDKLTFADIFVGAAPLFTASTSANGKQKAVKRLSAPDRVPAGADVHGKETASRPGKQTVGKEPLTNGRKLVKSASSSSCALSECFSVRHIAADTNEDTTLSVLRDQMKQQLLEEQRARQADLRVQERDRRRLAKKQLFDWLKEWSRPREDLLCEDHKELPIFAAVKTRLPPPLFASCLQLLEFVDNFGALFAVDDSGAHESLMGGVGRLTLPLLEQSLLQSQIAGPYINLLKMFLSSLLRHYSQEDPGMDASGQLPGEDLCTVVSVRMIDTLTVTEVLRRHLSRVISTEHVRWRWYRCGCFAASDCPKHQFRQRYAHILEKLSRKHVLCLSAEERMAVLECLMHELLMCAPVRARIDQSDAEVRDLRMQLRSLKASIVNLQRSLLVDRQIERRDEIAVKSCPAIDPGSSSTQPVSAAVGQTETVSSTPAEPKSDRLTPSVSDQSRDADAPVDKLTNDEEQRENLARRKEHEKKLQQQQQAEARCHEKLTAASARVALLPLGSDRAYRRYWLFPSVPALLIERAADTSSSYSSSPSSSTDRDSGELPRPCLNAPSRHCSRLAAAALPATELRHMIVERLRQQVRYQPSLAASEASCCHQLGLDDLLSRDVDLGGILTRLSSAKFGEDADDAGEGSDCDGCVEEDVDYSCDSSSLRRLMLCTADNSRCVVHCRPSDAGGVWSVCAGGDQLQKLIGALNQRGLRESELRTCLLQLECLLRDVVERCPVSDLTGDCMIASEAVPDGAGECRRSKRSLNTSSSSTAVSAANADSSLNFPDDMAVADIEEVLLRDQILDMEDKLWSGALGIIKVADRDKWRDDIVERRYSPLSDQSVCDSVGIQSLSATLSSNTEPVKTSDTQHNGGDSATSSLPLDSTATGHDDSEDRCRVVRQMAVAVLQLEQSIERRFLKEHFVDSAAEDDSAVMAWEAGVKASTSFSQLFLFLWQLNDAVLWSRSVAHARCKVCRKKSQPDAMLLCDSCNKGFHIFCLKPPLKSIPSGDWYCAACQSSRNAVPSQSVGVGVTQADVEASLGDVSSASGVNGDQLERAVKRGCYVNLSSTGAPNKRRRVTADYRSSSRSSPVDEGDDDIDSGDDSGYQLDFSRLSKLLHDLKLRDKLGLFLRPVKAKDAPMYHSVIREPMDLGTIQKKLNTMEYASNRQMLADVALVLANCCMYNQPSSDIHRYALKMRRYFDRRVCELRLSVSNNSRSRHRHSL